MINKNQANKRIQSLFKLPENRYNFELFYKLLSQPSKGLSLCQVLPEERLKIFAFFESDPLINRIYMINMVKPPRGPMELQQTIIEAYEKVGSKKDIFFIYNLESCVHLLKSSFNDFFQGLNLIRDFFMQFKATFVFFVTESLVTKMIQNAFDFYDWMKFSFTFVSESEDLFFRSVDTEDGRRIKYSRPMEKIEYLEKYIKKVKNDKNRSMRLFELGKLYSQVNKYEEALKRILESLEIEEKFGDLDDMAERYTEIARIYRAKRDLDQALKSGLKALDIFEKKNDRLNMPRSYNNIGLIYQAQGDSDRALEFFSKALEIFEENNDRPNTELVYSNMGAVYHSKGDKKSAADSFKFAGPVGYDESNWDELLERIKYKNVIPVIGHGLFRVEVESEGKTDCLLYDYLAEKLSEYCGSTINPDEKQQFAKACFACLKKDKFFLSDFLRKNLEGVRLLPAGSLWKLARIRDFNIFITTAYDDLLVNTIRAVRSEPTVLLCYTHQEPIRYGDDFLRDIIDSRGTLVFHIFGNMRKNILPAFTEKDMLETLLRFREYMVRDPRNIFEVLKERSLLFMGCGYDDWLYRLFIRIMSNEPYGNFGLHAKYVADDFGNTKKDPFLELPRFLRDYGTKIFYYDDSRNFVDLLFEKLRAVSPETIIMPDDFPGTVFISFEDRDRDEAERLAKNLRSDGIGVWLDERKIRGGYNADKTIINAIERCPVFIPLISRHSRKLQTEDGMLKYHVREWTWAYTRIESGDKTGIIIPVKIDDTAWMYKHFKSLCHMQIPGGSREGEYEKLKVYIKEVISKFKS